VSFQIKYNFQLFMDTIFFHNLQQCCGSGSGLDPDSIRSLDPDPDSESGSGSRARNWGRKKCLNWKKSKKNFFLLSFKNFVTWKYYFTAFDMFNTWKNISCTCTAPRIKVKIDLVRNFLILNSPFIFYFDNFILKQLFKTWIRIRIHRICWFEHMSYWTYVNLSI